MNTRTLEIIDKCIDMFATTHLERKGRQSKTYRHINKSEIIGVESQEIEADTYQSIAFLEISEILNFLVCMEEPLTLVNAVMHRIYFRCAQLNGMERPNIYSIE